MTRGVFVAFAMSVLLMWLAALAVDANRPPPQATAAGGDRMLAAILFSLGVLHVLLSAGIRISARRRWAMAPTPAAAARLALSTAVIALVLCEAPTLFGLVWVLRGGSAPLATFFFSFSLTAMAAHYVMRLRAE